MRVRPQARQNMRAHVYGEATPPPDAWTGAGTIYRTRHFFFPLSSCSGGVVVIAVVVTAVIVGDDDDVCA